MKFWRSRICKILRKSFSICEKVFNTVSIPIKYPEKDTKKEENEFDWFFTDSVYLSQVTEVTKSSEMYSLIFFYWIWSKWDEITFGLAHKDKGYMELATEVLPYLITKVIIMNLSLFLQSDSIDIQSVTILPIVASKPEVVK